MTFLQLSLLFLLVICNGLSVNYALGSNDGDTVADLLDKMEYRLERKEKERYEKLVEIISTLNLDTETKNKEHKKRLDQSEERQKNISKNQDFIVNKVKQQENYIKESTKISQCETARVFSRLPHHFDYMGINTCPANPHLLDETESGWITFQRRRSHRVSFYRNWNDYKYGFGSKDDDFWLGLETLHKITSSGNYELRVVLTYNGISEKVQYSSFKVENEMYGYRFKLGKYFGKYYGGNAVDSLRHHENVRFSTPDRDHDAWSSSCALKDRSGWWFTNCGTTNLNLENNDGQPFWRGFPGSDFLSSSEMKIRKVYYVV